MSYRHGLDIIAGNGTVPYVNTNTGNWEYAGQDSGIQAIPIKMTISQYETAKNQGAIESDKMYFITDSVSILYKNVVVQPSNWIDTNGKFVANIQLSELKSTDTVFIDLSSSLSDDTYIEQYSELKNDNIVRVTVTDGNLRLLAIEKPSMSLNLDVSAIKCIVR